MKNERPKLLNLRLTWSKKAVKRTESDRPFGK